MAPALSLNVIAPRQVRQLPNECLLVVARYLDGATLQNFRVSSKTFQKIADPILWQEIRLVPNIDCLQTFSSLIVGRPIAAHVRTFVYDTSWQSHTEELEVKSDKADASGVLAGNLLDRAVLTRCVQAQVKSAEGSGVEMCLLTHILTNLPNVQCLRSIERLMPRIGNQDAVPPYYRTMCIKAGLKVADLRPGNSLGALRYISHVRSLLLAAYSSCRDFEYLDLVEVPWTTFFQDTNSLTDPSNCRLGDFEYRMQVFKGLKYFDISFRNAPSRDPDTHLRALRELLKGCDNLERLRICMTDYVPKKYSIDYRMFSYLAPLVEARSAKPLMPKLRELHIDSCVCAPNDLINFLILHAASLRSLTLSDISLLRQEDHDRRGCWVEVIQSIRHTLRLDKMIFRKWLSNGGRQRWYVSEDKSIDHARLRPQIEGYVARQAAAPLPPCLNAVALKPGSEDVPKSRTGTEEEGDWTWTMTYGQSKTKDHRPDVFSGSDLFSKDVPLDSHMSDSPQIWTDWAYTKHAATYPHYKSNSKIPSKIKAKAIPPTYTQWSFTTTNVPQNSIAKTQAPMPAKNFPMAQMIPHASSTNSEPVGTPSTTLQAHWFDGIPPTPQAHHSLSSSSNISSTSPMNSQLYVEDDVFHDDISYQSPSQYSHNQTSIPYTPSYSSHGSISSSDFSSWANPPGSYHSSHISVLGPSSSDAATGKLASTSTYTQPSITWDDAWADPVDFAPPISTSHISSPTPKVPYPVTAPYGMASQATQQHDYHYISAAHSLAMLKQAQQKLPPYGAYVYAPALAAKKKCLDKAATTQMPEPPFGYTGGAETIVNETTGYVKHQEDDMKKKKAGIESYGANGW